ncbi:MAG: SMC family ATPase [Arcanobacterium sp.]|nr:SMC family ATPase [Arcanobacterium sp.]MDY5588500.1 SMC family ATPase [Arcanobacterium sp.]
MLIRHLEFSGIGPFGGQHSIDFDELTASGVFLIEGPTGTGKSTIIDAIVFALYGDVAGRESTEKRMRSSHANLTSESWVDLVFTVASGSYRVKRYPAQERAKKRGTGTVALASSAKLWKLSEAAVASQEWESGEPLASQARETSIIIADLVGISKNQFVQTVVLPQGQFADFLRLNSKDRAGLLEKIFRTGDIRRFTEELRARAGAADAQITAEFTSYSSALDAWLLNSGISQEVHAAVESLRNSPALLAIPESEHSDAELLELLNSTGAELTAAAAAAAHHLELSQERETAAHTALAEGKNHAAALCRREELLAQLAQLREQAPDMQRTAAAIAAHEAAQLPLVRFTDARSAFNAAHTAWETFYDSRAHAEKLLAELPLKLSTLPVSESQSPHTSIAALAFDDAPIRELFSAESCSIAGLFSSVTSSPEAACTHTITAAPEAPLPTATATTTAADTAAPQAESAAPDSAFTTAITAATAGATQLNTVLTAVGEQLGAAREAAEREAQARDLRATLTQQELQLTSIAEELTTVAAEQRSLPEQREHCTSALELARSAAHNLEQLTYEQEHIREQRELLHQFTAARAAHVAAKSEARHAIAAHTQEKSIFDELTNRWVASVAANLAEDLQAGTPCPVCGSREHPHMATPTSDHTTREQVEVARESLSAAATALTAASTALAAAAAREQELHSQLGDITEHSLAAATDSLTARIDAANAARGEAETLTSQLAALEQHAQQLTHREAELREQRARLESDIHSTRETLTATEEKLSAARGEFESVQELVGALEQFRSAVQQLREYAQAVANSLSTAQRTLDEAASALADSPFRSYAAAQAAHLDPEALTAARTRLEAHRSALSGVQAQLAAPEIAQLTSDEKPDVAALETAYATAHTARETAAQSAARAEFVAADASRLLARVRAASQKWHAAAQAAGPITHLANIATAGNASLTGIPLNIWVLLKRFDVVVERANEHLGEISRGRYELKRVNESSGNKKAGLDLHVIDRQGSALGDEERDTSSLSGGETFYTSLALALALAEVVQEEQGGVRIDTLLIDEGFGTLSDDVREAVMNTLTSLSRSGRVVGIVSHVAELKQMVPNRITLRRLADGSSTLSVVA